MSKENKIILFGLNEEAENSLNQIIESLNEEEISLLNKDLKYLSHFKNEIFTTHHYFFQLQKLEIESDEDVIAVIYEGEQILIERKRSSIKKLTLLLEEIERFFKENLTELKLKEFNDFELNRKNIISFSILIDLVYEKMLELLINKSIFLNEEEQTCSIKESKYFDLTGFTTNN